MILGIRPDDFEAVAHADPGLPAVEVEVAVLEELGSENHVIFGIDAQPVEAEELREAHDDEDAQLLAEGGSLFTARVDPRTSTRVGTTVTLAVDPAGFHFFDPDTGQTLRAREGELAATA